MIVNKRIACFQNLIYRLCKRWFIARPASPRYVLAMLWSLLLRKTWCVCAWKIIGRLAGTSSQQQNHKCPCKNDPEDILHHSKSSPPSGWSLLLLSTRNRHQLQSADLSNSETSLHLSRSKKVITCIRSPCAELKDKCFFQQYEFTADVGLPALPVIPWSLDPAWERPHPRAL